MSVNKAYNLAQNDLPAVVAESEVRMKLSVVFNGAPGGQWWAQLEAVSSGEGTTLTDTGGEGRLGDNGEVYLVRHESSSDCFRALVSALTAEDAEGGIPAAALGEVIVEGLTGWRADFAQFCWVRDDDFQPLGRLFADFDDWHLQRIYGLAGALTDLYKSSFKAQNPEFYESFWRLVNEDEDEVDGLTGKTLADIVGHLDLSGRADFWDQLLCKVHDLAEGARAEADSAAEARAAYLSPIQAYAKRAVYQRVGGVLPGMGNAIRFNAVVEYVETCIRRTGEYPVGKHTVKHSSTIQNGRAGPPTNSMEVHFPDEA
jgi:hypothetical protein